MVDAVVRKPARSPTDDTRMSLEEWERRFKPKAVRQPGDIEPYAAPVKAEPMSEIRIVEAVRRAKKARRVKSAGLSGVPVNPTVHRPDVTPAAINPGQPARVAGRSLAWLQSGFTKSGDAPLRTSDACSNRALSGNGPPDFVSLGSRW
ncbi:hypothetical protein RFN28_33130 [Mesorhizobium sp. VK24D]|uniref:Uncharacterized protein n=1 Tax=Mesorhizobium album TaxID=3072314 RepID=A0ABU4Y8J3_9HYPH|nr:hypothetical protein [Mesorhizobium sp. VK24D]MDX8483259.1 hypothetical protein [Mesorhizobium sp. VK24D]